MSIYAIGSADGHIKIGIARDPRQRLAELQVGNPHQLSLVHSSEPPDGFAANAVERRAHALLHATRKRGEWFNIEIDQAISAIAMAIELVEKNIPEVVAIVPSGEPKPRSAATMRSRAKKPEKYREYQRNFMRKKRAAEMLQLQMVPL